MGMKHGTWNVRSLYRAGSLTAVARELAKYKFDLVGLQDVSRNIGGTEIAGDYAFLCGHWNDNHESGTEFFVHKRNIYAVKSVEFLNDKMCY
jgi:hypothetical protein